MLRDSRWFRGAVALGIVQNLALALPAIRNPNAVLRLFRAQPSPDPKWGAFSAWLLMLLSLFYVPAAVDPVRYRPIAVLAVLSRMAGAVFFSILYRGQFSPWFGRIDLTLMVVQGTLLLASSRPKPGAEPT